MACSVLLSTQKSNSDNLSMTINLILPHRATVSRGETSYATGSPVTVYRVIATNVACLFSRKDSATIYGDAHTSSTKAVGTLYFEPDANIKSSDILTIFGIPGTVNVTADGGVMYDSNGEPHHIEFQATYVAPR